MPAKTFEAMVGRYPADVQTLSRAARTLVLQLLPGLDETVDASSPVIGYGYGTGYKGAVCTLLLSKTGVKIGLAYGATLPDPARLLTGSGKVHRFVPIRSTGDLKSTELAKLLKAANAAARARLS